MKDETSIFGARPERLERLVFEALQDFESEEDASPTASLGAILEKPGGYIDRYKLINILGEGGMGIVYLAEQEHPIKRRLALKVIKPGMDSKRVIARFEVERQALALLDHPNIAHVFDAGTTESGRPYFVMEFVEGLPITEHCDHHKLTVDERLKLFLQVCHAVHHAHQKGIIHRDIKPSNILVTTNEDQAVSKIIDFGVAKAVIQPLTERTLYTEHGQLFGTPEYMSPEQADMASEDIDIRSDIYSLGVLLYELLTGVLPFNPDTLRTGGIENIRKVIRETNPRTPSKQLTSLGEEARKVAERRRIEITALTRKLHKELEWIPLKAMRKERSERYRSAAELADDIENYLKGDPLIAGPPSTLYRARKFMRRHKALVTGVAAVLAVLLAGVFISTIFAIKADRARDKEIVARAQAQQRAEQYRRSLYLRSVILADRYYYDNDIRGMRDLLKACPEDLRQWEWYHLWRVSDQSIMTLRGHTREVRSVAFSPDGKRIVSGSRDTTIKVWDAGSDRVLMTLEGHEETVNSVAFSPDGRWIVSGSDDMTVKVWDAESGRMQINLVGHEGTVSSVVFSPDGRYVASGSADATIRIWDAVTGELIRPPLQPMRIGVASVAFSPDGGRIVSCSPNTIQVWDTESGSEPMTQMKLKGFVWSVAFHPMAIELSQVVRMVRSGSGTPRAAASCWR
jgi:serine/threonine protein kinase